MLQVENRTSRRETTSWVIFWFHAVGSRLFLSKLGRSMPVGGQIEVFLPLTVSYAKPHTECNGPVWVLWPRFDIDLDAWCMQLPLDIDSTVWQTQSTPPPPPPTSGYLALWRSILQPTSGQLWQLLAQLNIPERTKHILKYSTESKCGGKSVICRETKAMNPAGEEQNRIRIKLYLTSV